jgi:hydrogenase maturation protease
VGQLEQRRRVLIIAVGNRLRGDDGLAHEALRFLLDTGLPEAVTVRDVCQWTPELAFELAEADLAVLLDASCELPPGTIAESWLGVGPEWAPEPLVAFTHTWDPRALVAAANRWYGRVPRTLLVVGGGEDFGLLEDALTPAAAQAAKAMARRVHEELRPTGD